MKIKKGLGICIALLILLGAGSCQGSQSNNDEGKLTASGTLAADEIKIASEIGGLIRMINVQEGDSVSQGELLFSVDDEIFQAEKSRAEAGVKAAQAGVSAAEDQVSTAKIQNQLVLQQTTSSERALSDQAWTVRTPEEIDLPVWYYQKAEQLNIVQEQVLALGERLKSQKQKLDDELKAENNQDFLEVERNLLGNQVAFEIALHTLEKAKNAAQKDELLDAAQEAYDAVLANLESAQLAYKRELDTQAAEDILAARAKVAAAQSDLDYAQDRLIALQTGEQSLQVQAAEGGVSLAESGLVQAQLAVEQSKAALAVLLAQEDKMISESPIDGTVLSLNVMAGEVVGPGSTLMTIASLEELKLTVYISEESYGEVNLGQIVEIEVDSFPGIKYPGEVIAIADQAEFTPRNVQTVEGRKTTVYAVKIRVENLTGELKPGMPADVSFE